jgi:hypothetical protein
LFVVAGHGGPVGFAFFGELVSGRAVPSVVGIFGLSKTIVSGAVSIRGLA